VLIAGWLLLGLAALFGESGLLTLKTDSTLLSSGYYVSPFGALRYDLLKKSLQPSKWPWSQESLASILVTGAEDTAKDAADLPLELLRNLLK
jgi:hypothetical protein